MWFPNGCVASIATMSFLILICPFVRADESSFLPPTPQSNSLQQLLFDQTGLIAKSVTDTHSPLVLDALITIFKGGLPPHASTILKRLKYLNAYRSFKNGPAVAYFAEKDEAINIGGMTVYPSSPDEMNDKETLLSTLAHELGHALIFSRLTPSALVTLGMEFGGWPAPTKEVSSFYDPQLFVEHPQCRAETSAPINLGYLPTPYSCNNIHEWFSEVFASMIIYRLSNAGQLNAADSSLLRRYLKPPGHLVDKINSLFTSD